MYRMQIVKPVDYVVFCTYLFSVLIRTTAFVGGFGFAAPTPLSMYYGRMK